jgi:membrane-associated phospholipid phosphatase
MAYLRLRSVDRIFSQTRPAAPNLIDRKRPDRVVVHGRRHGLPRSGNAWDSFPSGHALHLGAIAGSVARFCPHRFRRFVWPSITALAATRILLLAHYLSDVVAGLALGVVLDWVVGRLFGEDHAADLDRKD